MPTPSQWTKDPDAVLDYVFDWTLWLDGDTIDTATATVDDDSDTPVVVDSTSNDSTTVTVFLSAGTAGTSAEVTCRITTSEGRTDDRTIRIRVRER